MKRKKRKPAVRERREDAPKAEEALISQYVFTFELIRHYPTIRSFMVKQPLKRSFKDSMQELFGGTKKGVYRL